MKVSMEQNTKELLAKLKEIAQMAAPVISGWQISVLQPGLFASREEVENSFFPCNNYPK
ncbi:hypothetical protein Desku_1010 [Desulfofundulus kuznetsovii DSM 6115]|uniref:Uncharacterized protein n=1 Tax=Desulfofundulus kuznetsovii (strain DSM 6115 / VKM B-1805 / 17) TaxID=760568 RepID=A0AAU8PXI3_DESK7|nr:hypothetical protein Desku_1010 [Desulfofundulus kuznetsovii DSM 6115]